MAARKNGRLAGPTHGTEWEKLPLNTPKQYLGTSKGAKANVCRANKRYPDLRFRSYKKLRLRKNGTVEEKVYIERINLPSKVED